MKASTSFKAVVSGVPGLLASTTDVKGGAAVVGCSVPCPPTLPLGPKKKKSPLKRIRIKKVPNCDKCRAKGKVRRLEGCCTIAQNPMLLAPIGPNFCSLRTFHPFLIDLIDAQYTQAAIIYTSCYKITKYATLSALIAL